MGSRNEATADLHSRLLLLFLLLFLLLLLFSLLSGFKDCFPAS